jgi:hypothetical protein
LSDFSTKVVITDAGRAAIASMIDTGVPALQISQFAVGTGGYLPTNPTVALAPDPTSTGLINEIFRTNNVGRQILSPSIRAYIGELQPGDVVGAIGESGLFATYLTGPNAGEVFLFALAHHPIKSITPEDGYTFSLVVPI